MKGCAHHDIKPDNILVRAGHFILSDLGESELVENYSQLLVADSVTHIKEVVGTVLYMSPAKLEHYHYCISNNLFDSADIYKSQVSKDN